MAELNRLERPVKKVGSFSMYTQSCDKKFPLNLASSTRSALVFSTTYLGLTRIAGGGGDSAQGGGGAIRSDSAHSTSTATKELQWYNVSTTKVFVGYKTEKQVRLAFYTVVHGLWWESSGRFIGEYNI